MARDDLGRDVLLRVSFKGGPYQLLPYDYSPVQQAIVPVVGWDGVQLACLGTAFAIDETGIFVTARHVVDEWVHRYQSETVTGQAGLYVVFESDTPVLRPPLAEPAALGGPLAIGGVTWHPQADLAVLQAQVPYLEGVAVPFPTLQVSVGLPHRGGACVAIGYARMHMDGAVRPRAASDKTLVSVDYERQLAATRGVIEEVHPVRRDSFRLTWPCFLTDARYDAGMSGSPVFDESGRVIGIVCSSTPMVDGQPFTSYATLTAALLPLHLELADNSGTVLVADLLGHDVEGLDDVDVDDDDEGKFRLVYTDEAIARVGD